MGPKPGLFWFLRSRGAEKGVNPIHLGKKFQVRGVRTPIPPISGAALVDASK